MDFAQYLTTQQMHVVVKDSRHFLFNICSNKNNGMNSDIKII